MSGKDDREPSSAPKPVNPGDQAPSGTPGTGENVCRHCHGKGEMPDGSRCEECGGTGVVIEEIGGA
jgi:RecJ-like exonuclease